MLKAVLISAGVIFVLFMAFGFYLSNTPEGKERQKQKDVIASCWEVQGKKSLEPGTARFTASLCEKMESDYEKKWGRRP